MKITDGEKTMTLEELANKLCSSYTAEECYEKCPASDFCYRGHKGMTDWLKKCINE